MVLCEFDNRALERLSSVQTSEMTTIKDSTPEVVTQYQHQVNHHKYKIRERRTLSLSLSSSLSIHPKPVKPKRSLNRHGSLRSRIP